VGNVDHVRVNIEENNLLRRNGGSAERTHARTHAAGWRGVAWRGVAFGVVALLALALTSLLSSRLRSHVFFSLCCFFVSFGGVSLLLFLLCSRTTTSADSWMKRSTCRVVGGW
jgi:drug/metabolite transporter (DMT)-like permease